MSCQPEWKLAVYADDELPEEERRSLETHLVTCQACRQLVVALRDEAELLSNALHERSTAETALAPRPSRARGFAIGVVPAVVGFIAITTVISWIAETSASSLEWFSPLRLRGAIQMGFDFVFMVRDQAPGLLELGVAMAALASVSALLTYAVTVVSRRLLGPTSLGIALLLSLATPQPSAAHFGMHEHDDIRVAEGEEHEGTLMAMRAENVDIDGTVTGDVFVFAHRVTIRGEVKGNVFIAGRDVDVSGKVSGSLHVAASNTRLDGQVERNAYVASENFDLAATGEIGDDLWLYLLDGGGVLEGQVGRDTYVAGEDSVDVRGEIERDLWVHRTRTRVLASAKIGGDIHAELEAGEEIDLSPSAQVGGQLVMNELKDFHESVMAHYRDGGWYIFLGVRLAAGFLAGMLLHLVAPWLFGGRLDTAGDFFRCMGIGLVVLLGVPLGCAVVGLTIVGLPIALVCWWMYLTGLFTSVVVTAALIGTSIMKPETRETWAFGLPLIAGLVIVLVAMSLPFVGGPIRAVVVLTGLGLVVQRARKAWAGLQTVTA